jgi:hypothetical protein
MVWLSLDLRKHAAASSQEVVGMTLQAPS